MNKRVTFVLPQSLGGEASKGGTIDQQLQAATKATANLKDLYHKSSRETQHPGNREATKNKEKEKQKKAQQRSTTQQSYKVLLLEAQREFEEKEEEWEAERATLLMGLEELASIRTKVEGMENMEIQLQTLQTQVIEQDIIHKEEIISLAGLLSEQKKKNREVEVVRTQLQLRVQRLDAEKKQMTYRIQQMEAREQTLKKVCASVKHARCGLVNAIVYACVLCMCERMDIYIRIHESIFICTRKDSKEAYLCVN